MKAFLKSRKKLHLWLLVNLVWGLVYLVIRRNKAWMNAVSAHVTGPLRRAIGSLCYRTDASVMEWLCVLAVLVAAGYVIWCIMAVGRARGRRGQRLYTAVLGALCAGLTFWSILCFLWGMDSYAATFQERSGLTARAVSVEELESVTAYFVDMLSGTADEVPRDENGLFAVSRTDILAAAPAAYSGLTAQWPFLESVDQPPKAAHFSRIMSLMDFTGVYCPFTGESNVNVDSPAVLLPATAAHELAHQRGFSSEQECNFLAIAASTSCSNAVYAYSGYLLGYIHLGNALYSADQERWQMVYDSLPETVKADMAENNRYWAQFADSGVKKVSNQVYDAFLKTYGQEQGLKSYGTVVDLLVAYYGETAE